jgi:hypothetical protein
MFVCPTTPQTAAHAASRVAVIRSVTAPHARAHLEPASVADGASPSTR